MSFLSFLSSHRLHWGAHRVLSDSLPLQIDLLQHAHPEASVLDDSEGESSYRLASIDYRNGGHVGFMDEPGP